MHKHVGMPLRKIKSNHCCLQWNFRYVGGIRFGTVTYGIKYDKSCSSIVCEDVVLGAVTADGGGGVMVVFADVFGGGGGVKYICSSTCIIICTIHFYRNQTQLLSISW